MRRINTTIVNVQVNDRTDRVNVVATLLYSLRRLRLFTREAFESLASQQPQMAKCCAHLQALKAGSAASPSWGGHRPSGGPGTAIGS
jgi:hypothetical protein